MIILYGHGGSENHGCEAIIRGTVELMQDYQLMLYSGNQQADVRYRLDNLLPILPDNYKYYNNPFMWIYYKKFKPNVLFPRLKGERKGTYYSIGGDNYCYPSVAKQIKNVNRRIRENGNRTVLWGASIEEEAMAETAIREDLAEYDLIVSRESFTTELLKKYGLAAKSVQMPDAAFLMKPLETELPSVFYKPVVGINLSPMILDYSANAEAVKEGYGSIIEYVLKETDYNVALIPHVLKGNRNNNDLEAIQEIRKRIGDQDRIAVIGDLSADRLKYIISRCEFFIGARTHSTIAAYSSCIPTLVVGYSIKALGIATDLFGTAEHYVVDVRNLNDPKVLRESFVELFENREKNRNHLKSFIPRYLCQYRDTLDYIQEKQLY